MYRVKKMEYEDIKDVAVMEKEIFKFPWAYESFVSFLDNKFNHFYLVLKDDELVGYFGIMMIFDDCDIYSVGVRPKYQGEGIGNFIIKKIIQICNENNVNTITLEVREFNYKAIGLYEKFGFKLLTRIKGYYSNPSEDGLLMRLDLDEE
ncbi:ribosomal protein S18-alanine N-acetyltransferase [Lagierella sp.]|uniref:ribosomal protein S18-alanine N-acetyltransferase n=1 Tax=Lagierella sp. TaxID=2849657 RepID=UPI00262F98F9|nr:ribosomal protein S18-alanine N-acetyltransferase [Lagierella sp.]